MRRFLFLGLIAILALSLLLSTGAMADPPTEGDSPALSSLSTEYFTISDPGGGAQPPMTYTDSQTHETSAGLMQVCLQDVGVNPDPTPPAWADDIANVYVDGILIGTYDSLNNPEPAPGPGPVQCFTTLVSAGSHVILVEVTYSWVAGSMFAKEIDIIDEPPTVWCAEGVNPSGKTPAAGKNPKAGVNPDGFYQLNAEDDCSVPLIFVYDASGFVCGPFQPGDVVKITEAPGATSECKMIGGPNSAVAAHITLVSDPMIVAVDSIGQVSSTFCLVPLPPK